MAGERKQFHDAETNIVFEVTTRGFGYKVSSPQLLGSLVLPKSVWKDISLTPLQGTTTDAKEAGNEWKWKTGEDFVSLTAKNQLGSVKIKIPVTIWMKMLQAVRS
jgi:hypothetical protein